MTMFWKLGTWLKGHKYAQLTCVLVPDDATNLAQATWRLIVDAKELYQILTSEGQLHYHQAAETPLVKGPFTAKLDPLQIMNTVMPFYMAISIPPTLLTFLKSVTSYLECD